MLDWWFSFKLVVRLVLDFIVTVMQPAVHKSPGLQGLLIVILPSKVLANTDVNMHRLHEACLDAVNL